MRARVLIPSSLPHPHSGSSNSLFLRSLLIVCGSCNVRSQCYYLTLALNSTRLRQHTVNLGQLKQLLIHRVSPDPPLEVRLLWLPRRVKRSLFAEPAARKRIDVGTKTGPTNGSSRVIKLIDRNSAHSIALVTVKMRKRQKAKCCKDRKICVYIVPYTFLSVHPKHFTANDILLRKDPRLVRFGWL